MAALHPNRGADPPSLTTPLAKRAASASSRRCSSSLEHCARNRDGHSVRGLLACVELRLVEASPSPVLWTACALCSLGVR
eukprot:3212601-Rhodomonas_salina.1